jgi:FkbM family methyltransferase
MSHNIKTAVSYRPFKILKRILGRVNKIIARKNIIHNNQLVIFSFDHIGLSINLDGRYENSELELLEHFIKKRMPNSYKETAIDIGANIGNHSIFLSNFFNKVYAFEPNPITYDVLSINSKYKSLTKNVFPLNIGLSNLNTKLPFMINANNIGGSKVKSKNDNIKSFDIIDINVKRADELEILQNENISLIKIDVEGHEINALKGARKIIEINKPVIIFEQEADEIINFSSEVIEYLKTFNYKFYTIHERFYLGEKFIGKLLSLFLSSFLGEQLRFEKTNKFNKRFHAMILAIQET